MRIKEFLYQMAVLGFGKKRVSRGQALSTLVRLALKKVVHAKNRDVAFSCFGFVVHASSYEALEFLVKEIFFEEQYLFYTAEQKPFIVDCGSNIGMSVLYFKYLYPEAEIVCFEPQRKAFELLTKNIQVNKLENVTAYNIALSNQDGEINFFEPETGVGLMASIHDTRETNGKLISVPTARISSFLGQKTPALLKIDVEGAEDLIIKDLRNANKGASQMIIEYHHGIVEKENSMADFLKLLELDGYTYNLKTSFEQLGSYQDVRIHLNKKL